MKRILLSLVMIVAVASVATGATRAYFSDTETIPANTFAAGMLDLALGQTSTLPFNMTNVVPGQSGEGKVTLTSETGSLDGVLDISLANLVENENGCVEPEIGANDPNCSSGGGDLGLVSLEIATFVDVNKDGIWNSGDIKLAYNGQVIPYSQQNYLSYASPRRTLSAWNNIMTMTSGQSVDLVIKWRILETWNYPNYNLNIIMTDSLNFDILTSLEQVQ